MCALQRKHTLSWSVPRGSWFSCRNPLSVLHTQDSAHCRVWVLMTTRHPDL